MKIIFITGICRFLLTRLSRGVTWQTCAVRVLLRFLLTRLSRGVTGCRALRWTDWTFLLTRLSRGVTSENGNGYHYNAISTHTPLARRDETLCNANATQDISTHTPLARRDGYAFIVINKGVKFLLTRLSRGVTRSLSNFAAHFQFLLTRLSRGVTYSRHDF